MKQRRKSTAGIEKKNAIFIAGERQQRVLESFRRYGIGGLTGRESEILMRLKDLGCIVSSTKLHLDTKDVLNLLCKERDYSLFDGEESFLHFSGEDETPLNVLMSDSSSQNALYEATTAGSAKITKFVR
jgi:hypothetical protein